MGRIPVRAHRHGRRQPRRHDAMPVEPVRAASGRPDRRARPARSTTCASLLDDLGRFLSGDLDLTHDDLAFFGSKIWQIVTSCRERRNDEYEKIGVVGLHRRGAPLARLPEAAGPRHHALAGRGEGPHREHEDDWRHLRPAALRHRHARAEHRPGAERPDQRRLDRSVAALPGVAGRRLSPRLEGDRGVVRWPARALGHRRARRIDVTVERRLLHLRDAGRGRDRPDHARDDQGGSGAGVTSSRSTTSRSG